MITDIINLNLLKKDLILMVNNHNLWNHNENEKTEFFVQVSGEEDARN